jgi:hypothetical protein
MRRVTPLVLWATLLASPLAAQAGPPAAAPSRPAAPARLHLYFVPAPEQLDGARTLTFAVQLDGKPHLQETIFLETASPEGHAFEILAKRPDLRARLARLAANPTNQMEIRLAADQNVIQEFPTYQEFLLYSRRLSASGITPRKASSLVLDTAGRENGNRSLPTKGMQIDPVCADQCNTDYWNCIDNYGCDYGDCSRCQSAYDQCIYYCPLVCVEPRSVTSHTTTQNWNGPTNTGNTGCYKPYSNYTGYYYYETVMEQKNTTVETTTHCDWTTSTSTTVWYSYRYCWNSTPLTCSYPTLWSTACHY